MQAVRSEADLSQKSSDERVKQLEAELQQLRATHVASRELQLPQPSAPADKQDGWDDFDELEGMQDSSDSADVAQLKQKLVQKDQ